MSEVFDLSELSQGVSHLCVLPSEIWHCILTYISCLDDIKAVSLTCRMFHSLVVDTMWRQSVTVVKGSQINDIIDLPIENLNIVRNSCCDAQLSNVSRLSSLRRLAMSQNPEVTSSGMLRLKMITLRELEVCKCDLDDAAISAISELESLQTLFIDNNHKVTNTGVSSLSRLAHLHTLRIVGCDQVTSAGLSQIQHLQLRKFDVGNSKLNDEAMSVLGQIKSLQVLRIYGNIDVTDDGISKLTALSNLTELDVSWCSKITDVGISHVVKLHKLTKLNISHCSLVTDAGFYDISKLHSLRYFFYYTPWDSELLLSLQALFSDRVKINCYSIPPCM